MKISFFISAMVLYVVRQSFCVNIRVGTVLFTKSDLVRKCWSENDKALLRARLVMQDYIYACFHIINTSTYGKLQNLMYLALADVVGGYLRAYVLPLTKKSYYAGQITYEDACRVFTFYDQIRTYLKTDGVGWVEPQKAIYKNFKVSPLEIVGGNPKACNILYTIEKKGRLHYIKAKCSPETSKLPDMKMKNVQEQTTTEGECAIFKSGFLFPTPSTGPSKSTFGIFSTPKTSNVSKALKSGKNRLRETASEVNMSTKRENTSSAENKLRGNLRMENETMEEFIRETKEKRGARCKGGENENGKEEEPRRIIIPLPILDDECEPHTIAVPFRKRPLRNLWKKTSAFILEHYYVAVLQCFISKGNTRSDIKNFNSQFHSWLISKVYPRLEDEKWYPAFGGILRVTETIKRFGAEARLNEPMSHDIAFMFRKGVGFNYPENEETPNSKDKTRDVGDIEFYYPTKSRRYYAFAILSAVAVWLIVFCGCAFFSLGVKDKQSVSYGSCRSQSTPELSTPSQKSDASLPPKKAVSFQFLVRFFKRNQTQETWQVYSNSNELTDGKCALEDSDLGKIERNESNKRLTFKTHKNNQPRMICGDAPDYSVSDLKQCEKPSTTCMPSFPFRKLELPKSAVNAAGEGPVQISDASPVERSKKVRTLWRNPCIWSLDLTESRGFVNKNKKKSWFKLPSKKKKVETSTSETNSRSTNDSRYSSDKRSSSYSCSGKCTNSSSSTTNYSSRTNLEDKCSSATMEFSENVISRHKFGKNGFEQKSSTKSESDYSCTSDNEY